MDEDAIKEVDLERVDEASYVRRFADCVVLTHDGKLLLQQRISTWRVCPGCLTTFGGSLEVGENPLQAIIRELKEELGAEVFSQDIVSLGAITEAFTNHTQLVYTYFWQDKKNTITGCYECEAVYYDRIAGALAHPKIMDYVVWQLRKCQALKLLK